ncbi:MAG: alpha-glucan family phosphorylase [Alphaproteobacteria bacterium]|nr:alpha-glucan family phosphorylase [Alphaproteobacteria bacterium]MCB9792101.1 alpha-glucan family phosphorylase [Alphaproteobacteria bacterium]
MNMPAVPELSELLPDALQPLAELAMNLWWSWDVPTTALFEALDPHLWSRNRHNPKALLLDLGPERLRALSEDADFVAQVDAAYARLQAYLSDTDTWAHREAPDLAFGAGEQVAYFSMEFGVHESMRIYSGGLGVLAGDHARSASDLGLGFVGVSLLYRQGYFRQLIDDGSQVAAYPEARFERLPITLLRDEEGAPLRVEVPHGYHCYTAQIWELKVGRVRLLLLDADHADNPFQHRYYTHQLYGGDARTRVAQEVLLGIGGVRALQALGVAPQVIHLNEGHTAFAPIELIRQRVALGSTMRDAIHAVRGQTVFTTHTPVPAGHDRFGWDTLNEALGGYRDAMGWPHGTLMDLGRIRPGDIHEPLCMTVLALKLSRGANGVSALHGEVSREMWKALYPSALTPSEVPIGHITNGVHPLFFLSQELREAFDAHMPGWKGALTDPGWWPEAVERLPDEVLWAAHQAARARLIEQSRLLMRTDFLDPEALTIGFARRFAPYKRANLIFTDPERLERLVSGDRPLQILFSGKAHPLDLHGQALIAEVLRWTRRATFRGRVIFLKDYDLTTGRLLTQGTDVWLNNPRRPREASGTSGMKAAMNGSLNASVLDGWWPEAYDGVNGWAIGEPRSYPNEEAQDAADAEALYRLLEEEIVPEFYDRDKDGVPRAWVRRMKRSIATCTPVFNTHRMVADYTLESYMDGR